MPKVAFYEFIFLLILVMMPYRICKDPYISFSRKQWIGLETDESCGKMEQSYKISLK